MDESYLLPASVTGRLRSSFPRRRPDGRDADLTPEQSVREFRLYQEKVARFLRETEPAAQSQAGIRDRWTFTR